MASVIPVSNTVRQPLETPTPWSGDKMGDFLRALAGAVSEGFESEAQRTNMRAVALLFTKMESLKDEGRVVSYRIQGWHYKEIKVDVYVPAELYARDLRMLLRDEIDGSLTGIGCTADACILLAEDDGEPS